MNLLQINSYSIASGLYKNLYRELDSKNINQNIFVPVQNDSEKENNYIELKNGNFIYKNTFNTLDRILYFTKIKKSYSSLLENIDINKIDIAHAHSLFVNGGIANELYKEHNINFITAVRNTDLNLFFGKMIHLRKKGLEILRNASKIVFISPAYKKRLIDNYIPIELKSEIEQKAVVIPNGINNYWLDNLNLNKKENNNKISLIYAGRIDKNKNILNICKVAQKLNDTGYSADLKIIGKGPEKENIEKYISEFDFIKLLDYMPKEELLSNYRNSDIFIMPSYNETFGLVYIEAMSQGLPIIYTQNEGVDGYFEEGSVGYSVDPDNIKDMVNKIELILNNYSQMSKNNVQEAQKFSWEKVSDQYIKVYEELI
jgi:glycosyltransferase involved in cell wall biosynthesis